jgi:GNAT superfamily N-acetyltransferase
VLLALAGADLAGIIELRDWNHISLLLVDRPYLRQGIARQLLQRSLEICRSRQPDLTEVSVYSSPYAVPIYTKLGFEPTAAEQIRDGIRFTAMKMTLSQRTSETAE